MTNLVHLAKKAIHRKSNPIYGFEHWTLICEHCCPPDQGMPYVGNLFQCVVEGSVACTTGMYQCVG